MRNMRDDVSGNNMSKSSLVREAGRGHCVEGCIAKQDEELVVSSIRPFIDKVTSQ